MNIADVGLEKLSFDTKIAIVKDEKTSSHLLKMFAQDENYVIRGVVQKHKNASQEVLQILKKYEEKIKRAERRRKRKYFDSLIANVPNVRDTYKFRGRIRDINVKYFKKNGCEVDEFDFGFITTTITRVESKSNK